jgi:hypothetical protein
MESANGILMPHARGPMAPLTLVHFATGIEILIYEKKIDKLIYYI